MCLMSLYTFSLIKAFNIEMNLGCEMGYALFFHSLMGTVLKAKILTNTNENEAVEIRKCTFQIPQIEIKKISIQAFLINVEITCQTIIL